MNNFIFVFGSNYAGRHGKGAALTARRHYGAIYGQGIGRQNRSYAIPTKDFSLKPLPLHIIREHVSGFIQHVRNNPDELFMITRIGTGLAGYTDEDIAPMFKLISHFENCMFHVNWDKLNGKEFN